MELTPGKAAPTFRLTDHEGSEVSLSDFRGRKLVLYFYPKDDTRGCTMEANQFNGLLDRFAERDVAVLGVSADDARSHRRFRNKYHLRFPLLCDEGGEISRAYGSYGLRQPDDPSSEGVLRSTFLINEQGDLERAWYGVAPDGHPEAVLAEL
ncbi:MAG TPA: peroxiredoxin [Candidatus Dormibacteraeota bacterium]|jgi:peroxiredoxin Q/BCP|nr:peroxiredoxin [Candidatus Dormibacteraeota bacterium]